MTPFAKQITEGALVADAYSLAAHWIYDKDKLQKLDIDWEQLNDHQADLHTGRKAGQFTHYGDQLVVLYEYAVENHQFKLGPYMKKWFFAMRHYDGYIDAATHNTLDNILAHNPLPCGFGSEDLSPAGRIGPLMALSNDEAQLIHNVDLFTRATHYTEVSRESAQFCARLLWALSKQTPLEDAIEMVSATSSAWMQKTLSAARDAQPMNPSDALLHFGLDCNAKNALPGAMYLLLKYKSEYKSAMIQNAKSGGDSAARAMVIGMLMVAAYGIEIVPSEWRHGLSYSVDTAARSTASIAQTA